MTSDLQLFLKPQLDKSTDTGPSLMKSLLVFLLTAWSMFLLAGEASAGGEEIIKIDPTDQQSSAKLYTSPSREKVINGSYIIVFADDLTKHGAGDSRAFVNTNAQRMAALVGGKIKHRYYAGIRGFAIEIEDGKLAELMRQPEVSYVEEDTIIELVAVQPNPTWGLDRIDEPTLPMDNFYNSDLDGSGVNAYVIDSGADMNHPRFTGRMNFAFDITTGNGGEDCQGHGTHVAGTIGSDVYGVAKNVTLHTVRVFGCGTTTSLSNILAGMDWVLDNAQLPAVANLSLGGAVSNLQDNYVRAMVSAGIVVVVAAGNADENACNNSPGRTPEAITVASTTSNDVRSFFSNYGSCVDLFAPGSDITSTWLNGGAFTTSGTSMASPHVAGVVALALQNNPNATPAEIADLVLTRATVGRVSDLAGSPNRLLYMGFLNDGSIPTPTPPPPSSCVYEEDFSGTTGWSNHSASTCTTGTFVRANPTMVTNGGVVTQVGGDSGGDGFAAFTAVNSSAGVDDVDGGVCIATSATISVPQNSELSIDWFHGQRDTGGDSNDYFLLDYSLNGGSSFTTLVSFGDITHNASWQTATAAIPGGSSVVLRVRVSDGTASGDLVEGGVDSISICTAQ